MGTRTATWGANAAETHFTNPVSLGITLDSQEYPNGTISLDLSSSSPQKAWNGTSNSSIQFFLCDSAGNNTIKLFDVAGFSAQYNFLYEPKSVTISNTAKTLKGKALYVKATGDTAAVGTYGKITMTINTAIGAAAVIQGNKIMASDYTQIGASVSAGDIIKISGTFSSGTKAEASTFNSQVLGL